MAERGEVRAVAWVQQGSDLYADAAIGALTITVANPVDFDEDGGTLLVNGLAYDYTTSDPDTGIITLATALSVAAVTGDWIGVQAGGMTATDLIAYVSLGDGDEVEVPIAYAERDLWPEGEYASPILVELADDLESITAVPGRMPSRDGGFITSGTLPAPALTDGLPPTSSPTPTVIGGIGAFFLRWVPPTNHDPLRYEVHCSATTGFTPDSTTLAVTAEGTSVTLRTLPGVDALGQPQVFSYGVPYYFRIIARDDDGAAAAGGEASGTMMQVSGPDIAAQSIIANQIVTGSLTGDVFSGQVLLGSTISTGALADDGLSVVGARVDLGPNGLFVYDSAGNAITGFPNDPSVDAFVEAHFDMLSAEVRDNFTMHGINNAVAASSKITLGKGISPPTAAPSIGYAYDTVQLDTHTSLAGASTDPGFNIGTFPLDPSQITSMCWDQVYACWQVFQQRSNGMRLWRFNADGTLKNNLSGQPWRDDFRDEQQVTGSRGGWLQKWTDGKWYAWDTVVGGGRWGLIPNSWLTSGSTAPPFLAFDEAAQQFMLVQMSTSADDVITVRRFHTVAYVGGAIQNAVSDGVTTSPLTLQKTGTIIGAYFGAADFGGNRYVTATDVYARFNVWTSSTRYNGATNMAEWDAPVTQQAFAWDGTNFWSVDSTGKMTKYVGWTWTAEPSTTYVGMSAYDSRTAGDPANPWPGQTAGQHETSVGTLATIGQRRRAKMVLTVPVVPDSGGNDDVNQWRVYWARMSGSTVPAKTDMKLVSTLGSPTVTQAVTITADPTGANPPGGIAGQSGASSNFPAGNPAHIVSSGVDASSNPIIDLSGDGSGRLGPYTWDTSGVVTNAPMPIGSVTMFAGAAAPAGWLICDGRAVSRTIYAALYTALGGASSPYGQGDASTTFNLPDFRSRFPTGVGLFAPRGQTELGMPSNATGVPPAEDAGRQDRMSHVHSHSGGPLVNSSTDLNLATNTTTGGTANRLTQGTAHTHNITGNTSQTTALGGTTTQSAPSVHAYQALLFIIKF